MENCSDRADRISFPLDLTGGDEFAVILSGKDFENREALMQTIREASMTLKKKKAGDIVASGIALYDPQEDHTVADVFRRADQDMYANKKELKEQHG